VESAARPRGDFAGLVDVSRIAVVGHSYGGYTALAAGGARIIADAFTTGCASARAGDPIAFLCDALLPRMDDVMAQTPDTSGPVDAVVSLAGDAAMFGAAGLAAVTAPVLVIGGTADHDSPFEWSTRLAYDGVSSPRKAEVALDGAGHFVFAGPCGSVRRLLALVDLGFCSDPVWDRARARAVVKNYVTAFLLSELAGVPSARAALAAGVQGLPDVGYRAVGY
jgi:predicted dienelactone hydrolase